MVLRVDLARPEHEQMLSLMAGIKELNEESVALGGNPVILARKDGALCVVGDDNRLIRATEHSLAARVRSHCEPGRYRSEKDGPGGTSVVWVEQPKLPRDLIRGYISGKLWPGVPEVRHVVSAPLVRPDFTVYWGAGWDAESGCWVEKGRDPDPGLEGSDPCKFFDQFALSDRRQVSDCLAAALTPLLATAIFGPIPGFIATATNPGSGKSELASLLARMAGHTPTLTRWPGADELNKTVSAYVKDDEPVVIYDNIKRDVDSPDLESIITARSSSFRIMRTHDTVNLDSITVFYMTVNNATVSQDLQRRCIIVDLDPKGSPSPRKWQGTIGKWGHDNRAALVTLLCSLIDSWRDAGCPPGSVVHPGFEEWSRTVSGILEHAGIAGMWEARDDVITRAVSDASEEFQEILERIYNLTAGDDFSASVLWETVSDPVTGDLVVKDFLGSLRGAGKSLAKLKGSYGHFQITKRRSDGSKWKVSRPLALAS